MLCRILDKMAIQIVGNLYCLTISLAVKTDCITLTGSIA